MTPTSTTPGVRGSQTRGRGVPAAGRGAPASRGAPPAGRGAPPAGRGAQPAGPGASGKSNGRSAGHRGMLRKPTVSRRVSGPAGGLIGARPASAPRGSSRTAPRRPAQPSGLGLLLARARVFIAALPDHPLLDRIVRGRAWIPILGVLLAGIVAMQVEVLKLSAGVGRSLERGTALQSRNEQLRASVAALSDGQRIERLAASMGMVMPAPEAINFLDVRPGVAIARALTNIHPPDAGAFAASLPLIDTPAGAAAAAASAGATSIAGSATPSGG